MYLNKSRRLFCIWSIWNNKNYDVKFFFKKIGYMFCVIHKFVAVLSKYRQISNNLHQTRQFETVVKLQITFI
jgi:hypothetical protein